MRKKVIKNKDGSALLIAIAIMAIFMMLSLALLLVSYSLHSTAGKQQKVAQNKEIAQSLSRMLEKEITLSEDDIYKAADIQQVIDSYPLWFYLRYNVWTGTWKYYNPAEYMHSKEDSYRYFKIDAVINKTEYNDEISDLINKTTIALFWECDSETFMSANRENAEGVRLGVEVTCGEGNTKCAIISYYDLDIDGVEDEGEEDDMKNHKAIAAITDPNIKLNNTDINYLETWTWTFNDDRQ